jgi:YD repeat-containing protein
LVADQDDPFGAGAQYGVEVLGPDGPLPVARVLVDPQEPRDLLVELEQRIPDGTRIRYAWDGAGAIRDSWHSAASPDVRRWALPAELEVHG